MSPDKRIDPIHVFTQNLNLGNFEYRTCSNGLMRKTLTLIFSASCRFYQCFLFCYPCWFCSLMRISSFTLCVLQWGSRSITNSKIPALHEVEKLKDASHRFYILTVFLFPGLKTIVDWQWTYLVVAIGLPDLLLPASNLIGSEKLSA